MISGAVALLLAAGLATDLGGVRSRIMDRLHPNTTRISSLAVIPLESLSGDQEQEYFAEGLTDQLITNLAQMGSTRVTSRASILRYKGTKKTIQEIGHELNVDAIVEGTVTRSGNRVRITAQLIQVSTDMHLWAEAYQQNISETLDLQGKVATDIAHKIDIMVRPLESGRAVNPQAYGLYLKGRYYFYLPVFSQRVATGDRPFSTSHRGGSQFCPRVFRPCRYLPGCGSLWCFHSTGSTHARQGSRPESSAIGRQSCQRALRPGNRLHLVRLGLGAGGKRIPARVSFEPQRCLGPELVRGIPVAAGQARPSRRRA